MGDAYEQWREADRKAHELELWIRSNRARSNSIGATSADIERAKQLRAESDRLFELAMREMHAKVHNALAGWPPGPAQHKVHTGA